MRRAALLTSIVMAATMLVTRLVAPASSAPVSVQAPAPKSFAPPALVDVNAEVERLRDRLSTVPSFPAPTRDPFNFGSSPERTRATLPPPVVMPEAPPAPPLPRLVAILSSADDSSQTTAVFAVGDDVQLKKAGDDVAGFHVETVGADATTLVESSSHSTFTLALH